MIVPACKWKILKNVGKNDQYLTVTKHEKT